MMDASPIVETPVTPVSEVPSLPVVNDESAVMRKYLLVVGVLLIVAGIVLVVRNK